MADVRGASGVPLAAAFAASNTPTPSTPLYVDLATGNCYVLIGSTVTRISAVITTGTTAPASTPGYVGQFYIDTTHKQLYFSTGVASSSDWNLASAWS